MNIVKWTNVKIRPLRVTLLRGKCFGFPLFFGLGHHKLDYTLIAAISFSAISMPSTKTEPIDVRLFDLE